jgi:hypothetical protein
MDISNIRDMLFMRSGRLFARPSFLEGVSRIFDFAGSLNQYNENQDGKEADVAAIYSDWASVGDDLKPSMYTHETKYDRSGSK